jgi:hypothetical protein
MLKASKTGTGAVVRKDRYSRGSDLSNKRKLLKLQALAARRTRLLSEANTISAQIRCLRERSLRTSPPSAGDRAPTDRESAGARVLVQCSGASSLYKRLLKYAHKTLRKVRRRVALATGFDLEGSLGISARK